jgi:hypothetical protein
MQNGRYAPGTRPKEYYNTKLGFPGWW